MFYRSKLTRLVLYTLAFGTIGAYGWIGLEISRGKSIGDDFRKSSDEFNLFKRKQEE
jgi:hypothetical protein